MDTHNGPERQPTPIARQHAPITEEGAGVTLDSGAALCRFVPQRGGRLDKWQWRYTPPQVAMLPEGQRYPYPPIELVDPKHGALVDHFLALGTRPDDIAQGTEREFGDFVEEPYRSQAIDSGGEIRIGLLRDGAIRAGKRIAEVRMAKSAAVRPGAGDIAALYRVINSSLRPLQILFAVEFNLYAPGLTSRESEAWGEGYYLIDGLRPEEGGLGSRGVSPNATHAAILNPRGEMALQLGWDREADLWRVPREGSAGCRLFIVWRIQLPPRDNWAMGLWLAPG